MKYCTHCGFNNDDDATFCNSCGKDMERGARSSPTPFPINSKKRNPLWLGLTALLVVLLSVIFWHLKNSNLKLASHDNTPSSEESAPSPSSSEPSLAPVPEAHATASEVADTVFGSDQNVEALPGKPIKLKKGGKEIDEAESYHYTNQNCNRLFTDVIKQAGHAIQSELARVTKISEDEENKLGRELAKEVEKQFKGSIDKDKQWLAYIQALGSQLIKRVNRKGIDYHFHVIRNNTVNAFAIPGGNIYFFTGMLKEVENEAQLAAVIAHEIKHVDLRHCIALYQILGQMPEAIQGQLSFIIASFVKHPFDSRSEAEADRRGLELVYSFGYSPYQIVKFWERNKSQIKSGGTTQQGDLLTGLLGQVIEEVENVITTHPPSDKRACSLKNHIIKLQKEYPRDEFYKGRWNYQNKVTMFDRQM